MWPALNEGQVKILKESFKKADKDGKGKLSVSELKEVLHEIINALYPNSELPDVWVEGVMRIVDKDWDNMLNYEELSQLFYDTEERNPQDTLRNLFKMADGDRDGKLCKKDLAILLRIYDDEEPDDGPDGAKERIQMILTEYDKNGDEMLDFEEFSKMMIDYDSDFED